MIQYIKFGQNPSFGSRDKSGEKLSLVKIWHSKCWYDLKNKVKVTKILSFLSHVPIVFLCKFGPNQPIGSGDRVQTRLIFAIFTVWWPWKLGQAHQNLIKSLNHPYVIASYAPPAKQVDSKLKEARSMVENRSNQIHMTFTYKALTVLLWNLYVGHTTEVNNKSIRLVLRWRNKSQDLILVAILLLYEGSSLYRLNSLTKPQPRFQVNAVS